MDSEKYGHRTLSSAPLRVTCATMRQARRIDSVALSANDDKSRYVYLHKLYGERKEDVLSFIEKTSPTRWPSIDPEVFFYSELNKINQNAVSPKYYGSKTTRHGTRIFLEHVQGPHPDLAKSAANIAKCIAYIERTTSERIYRWSFLKSRGYIFFDFFFSNNPRKILPQFDYIEIRKLQENIQKTTGQSMELLTMINPIVRFLNSAGYAIKERQKCFSHLDFRAQNLINSEGTLYLLDWGSAKIGRLGFDAGAYLAAMLMRQGVEPFTRTASHFLSVYKDAISPYFPWASVRENCNYIFLSRALLYFLKPTVIARHINSSRIDTLISKQKYLISLFDSIKSN